MSTATESASAAIHRRRATESTAVVLPMTNAAGPRARVDAGGTRLRLRALHVMGHGSARISRALGVREETIQRLVRGDTTLISPNLRDTITDLYDAWWDKRAPERTRAERAAATTRPPPRLRRQLVRPHGPRRRQTRHPRLPPPKPLAPSHRHRHRARLPPADPPSPKKGLGNHPWARQPATARSGPRGKPVTGHPATP